MDLIIKRILSKVEIAQRGYHFNNSCINRSNGVAARVDLIKAFDREDDGGKGGESIVGDVDDSK